MAKRAAIVTGGSRGIGRAIVDGAKSVRIFGKQVPVRATAHTFGGLSGHAGQRDLLQWIGALAPSRPRILLTHVLPNLAHLVLITFVLMFSGLVLSEAILSWLGIGIDGSWGQMIDQARDELARDPIIVWNLAAASAALFALILSVNIVGDALRDVLDPRTLRDRR